MARQGAPRNSDKERSWRRLIQQWRRSEQTIRDFCVEHEVSEPSFFAWRRTIAERDRQRGRPGSNAGGDGEKTQDPPAFVPLRVVSTVSTPAGTPFEVVLRDGCIVRVPAGFDPTTLRQLLTILKGERGERGERPC
jgi:hypothetical protein